MSDTSARRDTSASRRNSNLVAAGIFLSRIAGFVRQRAIGYFLGLSFATDAFSAAFRIPNLMQNLLGEGVLSASFIPVYARLLDEGREREAGHVAGAIAGLLTAVAGLLVVLGVVFAEPLTSAITPGLPPKTHELTVVLMRIITPGIGVLVLSAWCLGILNSHRRFFLSYVAPVLWNLAQIVALVAGGVLLLDHLGAPDAADTVTLSRLAQALAWGTLAGGLLQFLVQLPFVLRLSRGLRLSLDTTLPGVRRTVRAFVPIVAGRGVVQLLAFVDVVLASLLVSGAIAALTYAQQLYVLPISLFGMSVAAAELPELSSADAEDRDTLAARLDAGLSRIAFYVVPSTVAFLILGDVVVGALFRTGSFDHADVVLVWIVLAGFAVGLLATTSSRLLQSALYGAGDARTPAKIAAVRVLLSAGIGVVLMLQLDRIAITPTGLAVTGDLPALRPLAVQARQAADFKHLGAAGLSVAAGLSAWVEFRLLQRTLVHRVGREIRPGGGVLRRTLVAAAVAAVVAGGSRLLVGGLHPILGALVALPLTGGAYLAVAHRLELDEAAVLVRAVRRRVLRR